MSSVKKSNNTKLATTVTNNHDLIMKAITSLPKGNPLLLAGIKVIAEVLLTLTAGKLTEVDYENELKRLDTKQKILEKKKLLEDQLKELDK